MSLPMAGVKVVEVAQFTYVPSAGATLADWGATVFKIEHSTMGDAQRGMVGVGPAGYAEGSFSPIMDTPTAASAVSGSTSTLADSTCCTGWWRRRRVPHQLPPRRANACASTSTTSVRSTRRSSTRGERHRLQGR
ncbi:MAG: CoA transferase [Acidimicrobiia bacterium]